MDAPGSTPRTGRLRTALRRLVLGAFVCAAAMIVLLAGQAMLSITGLTDDPHGYGVFAGILLAAVLAPIALALWALYRWMRRGGKPPAA